MSAQPLDQPEVLVLDPRRERSDSQPTTSSRGRSTSDSPTAVFVGIGITAVGFVLMAIAWGLVADETNVALQMPYLLSGGIVGLGIVLVGLTIVSAASKRRDIALREQQTQLLADALLELRDARYGDGR